MSNSAPTPRETPARREARRLLMQRLRSRQSELGLHEKRVLVHDEDWEDVRRYAERLLVRRMAREEAQADD